MPRYDWDALKAEWLLNPGESFNAFRKRKGIGNQKEFYRHVKDGGWLETHKKTVRRTEEKVTTTLANDQFDKWKEYRQLHRAFKAQGFAIIKKTLDEAGQLVKPLSPNDTKTLIEAFKSLAQAESFIDGGPTERSENKNLNLNVLSAVVDLVEKRGDDYRPL